MGGMTALHLVSSSQTHGHGPMIDVSPGLGLGPSLNFTFNSLTHFKLKLSRVTCSCTVIVFVTHLVPFPSAISSLAE